VTSSEDARYWERVAVEWIATSPQRLWREYCDRMNDRVLRPWLAERPRRRLLKTDLFDEVVGEHGLVGLAKETTAEVFGVDLSATIARTAGERHPGLRTAAADVRRLPFASGAFEAVLSNSTLDHFESLDEVEVALEEIHRVLAPGGDLFLTLDNLQNPVIALRARLGEPLLRGLRLAPYRVGATCGPRRLRDLLVRAGFRVESVRASMHCPRLPAVWLARLGDRLDRPGARARLVDAFVAWERLERFPTRFLTAYFLVARACRE
jgi:SAM-dependent methyltransferase